MCPFPEWQREVHKYSEWIKAVEEAYDNMYVHHHIYIYLHTYICKYVYIYTCI